MDRSSSFRKDSTSNDTGADHGSGGTAREERPAWDHPRRLLLRWRVDHNDVDTNGTHARNKRSIFSVYEDMSYMSLPNDRAEPTFEGSLVAHWSEYAAYCRWSRLTFWRLSRCFRDFGPCSKMGAGTCFKSGTTNEITTSIQSVRVLPLYFRGSKHPPTMCGQLTADPRISRDLLWVLLHSAGDRQGNSMSHLTRMQRLRQYAHESVAYKRVVSAERSP